MTADREERPAAPHPRARLGWETGEAASGSEAVGEELCSSRRVKVIEGYATPANGSAHTWGLCGAHLF